MVDHAPRILLADDEQSIQALLSYPLRKDGYEVIQAADGREALQRFSEAAFDLLVLDVMMPRLDGLEVARRLRQDPSTQDLRLVLVSARAQAADLQRGEDMGVDAYITKPFEPDVLVSVVQRLADARPT